MCSCLTGPVGDGNRFPSLVDFEGKFLPLLPPKSTNDLHRKCYAIAFSVRNFIERTNLIIFSFSSSHTYSIFPVYLLAKLVSKQQSASGGFPV